MSESQKKALKLLDTKLDLNSINKITTCAIIMIIAILIHDGDHIRQALKWGYSIPVSLWVLNLTVYVFPVVTLFLAKSGRASASIVGAVAGVFTSASFDLKNIYTTAAAIQRKRQPFFNFYVFVENQP